MIDRDKVDVELWELATQLDKINWSQETAESKRAILHTAARCGHALLLDIEHDEPNNGVRAYVIPESFKI